MSISLGMNGFGRIGRYLLRLLADSEDIRITAINARADNASLAHLFKYDSVYGIFPGTVDHDDNGIIINGRHIEVTRCKTGEWEWARLGIDIAVETTGTLKKREDAAQHLQCGAKKVVVSAPCKEADATIVMGVNDDIYDAAAHTVLSAASCTTNCLAPVAKVLNDAFGIRHGLMTTIHSYTMSQRILDGSHKDLRRARAACVSMIPTSTGAAKALALVVPALKGKLDGMAVRVPTPDISLVDLTWKSPPPPKRSMPPSRPPMTAPCTTIWATATSPWSPSTSRAAPTAASWTPCPPRSWTAPWPSSSSGTTTNPASPTSWPACCARWLPACKAAVR